MEKKDSKKTKEELIRELEDLRKKLKTCEEERNAALAEAAMHRNARYERNYL